MSRRPDAPSLAVVAAGGIGVLAVLAFVVAVGLGGTTESTPGEKVRVVADGGPAGVAVLAGRCLDERVRSVALIDGAGDVVWRIESRKGSIERRYVVGAAPPLGFEEGDALLEPPSGTVVARVTFTTGGEEVVDERAVDLEAVPPEGGLLGDGAPACGGDEGPGGLTVLFAVAALVVVAGYGVMVARLRRR